MELNIEDELIVELSLEDATALREALTGRKYFERTLPYVTFDTETPVETQGELLMAMRNSGKTNQEIADALGVSEATVRRRLHKARYAVA